MAAPTLDGSATGIRSGTNVNSLTLTTTQSNDIICVLAYAEYGSGGPGPAMTSVSGGGLTWTRRVRSNGSLRGSMELWWALAPSALSGVTITMNYAGGFDDAAALAFGVNGCNTTAPWDANSSLPATQSANSQSTPSFSGISTSGANDFLIFACSSNTNWTSLGTVPSGFTGIGIATNGGGALYADCGAAYQGVTAQQSNATFTWGSSVPANSSTGGCEFIFDALTADSAAAAVAVRPQIFVCT